MRKKAGPVIAAILLIVVIGLILVVGKKIENYIPSEEVQDLKEYFGINAMDDVAVIRDQELSDMKGKCLGGSIYLDFDTVHDELNSRFYWDKNEKLQHKANTHLQLYGEELDKKTKKGEQ